MEAIYSGIRRYAMSNRKSIVITAYGHNKNIDRISITIFDEFGDNPNDFNAETYCNNLNSIELEGNAWVFAKNIEENIQYVLDSFIPKSYLNQFENILLKLDDKAIQKVLRECDSKNILLALKGSDEIVYKSFFKNMSQRAVTMMKEDLEYMGPVRIKKVEDAQEQILRIIRYLEDTGEITIGEKENESRK